MESEKVCLNNRIWNVATWNKKNIYNKKINIEMKYNRDLQLEFDILLKIIDYSNSNMRTKIV